MDFLRNLIFDHPYVLFCAALVLCIAGFGLFCYYRSSFKQEDLVSYLDHSVSLQGYFYSEFLRYCNKMSVKLSESHVVGNEAVIENSLRSKLMPMLFAYEPDEDADALYFSPMFCDYVINIGGDVRVGQFYSILKQYVISRQQLFVPESHKVSEFEKMLYDDITSRVLSDIDLVPSDVLTDKETVDAENAVLRKKLKHASYNLAVRDIKLHSNKGILPVRDEYLQKRFINYLADMRVYTPINVISMYDEDCRDFAVTGCYIIMNTYNNKIFVGSSDNIFSRVYALLKDKNCGACPQLRADIENGDLILVKFVPMDPRMYSDVRRMQRDLILAYDCAGDRGYNKLMHKEKMIDDVEQTGSGVN